MQWGRAVNLLIWEQSFLTLDSHSLHLTQLAPCQGNGRRALQSYAYARPQLTFSDFTSLFDCRLHYEIMDIQIKSVAEMVSFPGGLHSSGLSPLLFPQIVYSHPTTLKQFGRSFMVSLLSACIMASLMWFRLLLFFAVCFWFSATPTQRYLISNRLNR